MTKTVTDYPNVTASRRGCEPGISKKSANITSELRAERKQVSRSRRNSPVKGNHIQPFLNCFEQERIGAYDVTGGSE